MSDAINGPSLDLTCDNPHLSRPTSVLVPAEITNLQTSANLISVGSVADFVRDSIAANTKRAYRSDLAHFESWGGSIPGSADIVAAYLAVHADTLSVATLVRRLASISKAHEAKALPKSNPLRARSRDNAWH
jgi:hypothetical protein